MPQMTPTQMRARAAELLAEADRIDALPPDNLPRGTVLRWTHITPNAAHEYIGVKVGPNQWLASSQTVAGVTGTWAQMLKMVNGDITKLETPTNWRKLS